jgi:hypothetical protein
MRLVVSIAVALIFTAVSANPVFHKRSVTCGLADNDESCTLLDDINAYYCCDEEILPFNTKGYFVHCNSNTGKIVKGYCGDKYSCGDLPNGQAKCVPDL